MNTIEMGNISRGIAPFRQHAPIQEFGVADCAKPLPDFRTGSVGPLAGPPAPNPGGEYCSRGSFWIDSGRYVGGRHSRLYWKLVASK